MRKLKNMQSLVGKTIKSVDDQACNCVTITCHDGTVVLLEAENIHPSIGLIGIVPYRVKNKK